MGFQPPPPRKNAASKVNRGTESRTLPLNPEAALLLSLGSRIAAQPRNRVTAQPGSLVYSLKENKDVGERREQGRGLWGSATAYTPERRPVYFWKEVRPINFSQRFLQRA
jgi:hypothetical protein